MAAGTDGHVAVRLDPAPGKGADRCQQTAFGVAKGEQRRAAGLHAADDADDSDDICIGLSTVRLAGGVARGCRRGTRER